MNAQEIADARLDANALIDSFARSGGQGQAGTAFRLALYVLQALNALDGAKSELKVYESMVSEKWLEARGK